MHGALARFSWLLVIVLATAVGCDGPGASDDFADVCFDQCDTKLTLRSGPVLPSFDDLLVLSPLPGKREGDRYTIPDAPLGLEDDVNALLDTPEISNQAFHDGVRPHRPEHPTLGPSLRAMFWNIERGNELAAIKAAFSAAADPAARRRFLDSRVDRDVDADEVTRPLEALSLVDVVILNEVDRFVARTEWVARQLITRFVSYSSVVLSITSAINMFRLKDDPTGVNIPILFPNPEKGLFDAVEDATFADAGRFDFRGDETRTVNGTAKTLANSNQRDGKGFKTTHALARTIQIGDFTVFGRWKIDWMFVRGYARTSRDSKATYRMAPHFPRTLEELNDSAVDPETGEPGRMSDHAPLTVVLPIGDTCPDQACAGNPVPSSEFTDITWDDTFLAEGGN